jgi:phenylalanyl-tRNA synthetase beta subunit
MEDVTIELNNDITWSHINDFYEIIRNNSNDFISNIKLVDKFYNKKFCRWSLCALD